MAEAQAPLNFNPAELIKRVEDTEKRLQTKDAEIQVYKMLMSQMEEELAQAKKIKALHEKQNNDVDSIKTESEKTLTKAKSMIFEKTKIIKNQELQIEAFMQQIESLKEVVRITKDLLEIRNLEIKQLETKISAIEGKTKAEHERYDLMHQKLEAMIRHNGELKREYETQLCLFSALRERYNERELAKDVVDDLKDDVSQERSKVATENQANGNNVKTEEPINEDQEKKHEETNTTVNAAVNVEATNDKEEMEIVQPQTHSALVDAKNRLDNMLSVLENTLGLEVESTNSVNKNEDQSTEPKNVPENASQENILPNNSSVEEQKEEIPEQHDTTLIEIVETSSDTNSIEENSASVAISDSVATESKPQNEANSVLDNLISALKNTIGLGSDSVPECITNTSQISDKID